MVGRTVGTSTIGRTVNTDSMVADIPSFFMGLVAAFCLMILIGLLLDWLE